MEYSGCYEAVNKIVLDATKQFGALYTLNQRRYDELSQICEAIDEFVESIECNFVDVSVDGSKQLTVDIGCDEVVFEKGRSDGFFTLIQSTDSFSFSKSKGGNLCIALNIDGLWEVSHG